MFVCFSIVAIKLGNIVLAGENTIAITTLIIYLICWHNIMCDVANIIIVTLLYIAKCFILAQFPPVKLRFDISEKE